MEKFEEEIEPKKEKDEIFARRISKERNRDEMKTARRDVKKMVAYLKQIYDQEKEKLENNKKRGIASGRNPLVSLSS